ncbi:hypothetical protein PBY51_004652 [Eleginops maclovinus]|uniref:Uncharacterized protein n=1 Tax=Eleginops maclovinus TaxID=56733 RepID=A0AAN8AXA4_ELEMC|nr:hypothetical protein PBY51_004652 [Eleginops maclovinus]
MQWGCADSQVMNCSRTDGGFKLKHCITTYSRSLDLVLSRGCATSRHCQQTELPGVSLACCDWSLCNGGWWWAGSVCTVIISLISSTWTQLYDITEG